MNKNNQLATYHKRQGGITNKKVQLPKNHIHAKLPCFGSRTRTCDLWFMRPISYQLLHPDMMLKKIPPAFTSKRYYYNSILML